MTLGVTIVTNCTTVTLLHPYTLGTFPSFLELEETAGAYSLQIYDYYSQIQREVKVFLLIVTHNTE